MCFYEISYLICALNTSELHWRALLYELHARSYTEKNASLYYDGRGFSNTCSTPLDTIEPTLSETFEPASDYFITK